MVVKVGFIGEVPCDPRMWGGLPVYILGRAALGQRIQNLRQEEA